MKKVVFLLCAMLFIAASYGQTDPSFTIKSKTMTAKAFPKMLKINKYSVGFNIDSSKGTHNVIYFTPAVNLNLYQYSRLSNGTWGSQLIAPGISAAFGYGTGTYAGNGQWNINTTITGGINASTALISLNGTSGYNLQFELWIGIPGLRLGTLLSGVNVLGYGYNCATKQPFIVIGEVWQIKGLLAKVLWAK
jgi:hypothetical protein